MPLAVAVIAAAGVGCVPADSNIVGARDAATGTCSPACGAGQTCVNNVCIGDGLFRTTLTWDRPGDLDLYVTTPGGQTISFRSRTGGGGTLDRDDRTGTGPENVFWTTAPPLGEYIVCVVPFAITGATNFTLTTRLPNGGTDTRSGARSTSDASASTCTRTSPHFVVSYTITGGSTGDAGASDAATDAGDDAGATDAGATDAGADAGATEDAATDAGATEDASVLPDVDLGVDVPSLEDVAAD
ncbi:MAG: hypothetical protein R3A52_18235 [Polyangiales bacterium]